MRRKNPFNSDDLTDIVIVGALLAGAYFLYLEWEKGQNSDMGGTDFGTSPATANSNAWSS